MKKKNIIITIIVLIAICASLFFILTDGKRTDVYLGDYKLSKDRNTMTLEVGVSSSAGYIRKMKQTSGSMNYYLTFYSTFGINSKLGAKDTFKIKLDNNVNEIYFYTGNKGYKKVLEKDTATGEWILPKTTINVEEKINKIIKNGPMTSSNPFDYINASKDIYDELLQNPKETFEYAIKDLIDSNANDGLKSYIEALLCSEINTKFKYDFESARDFLKHYKEYLKSPNNNLNRYEQYSKSLLK